MGAETLLTPLRLGRFELTHRVVMPPLTRMRAGQPGNVPGELNAEYYAQRATAGGLLIAEASQISPSAQGLPGTPGIYSDEQISGWQRVTEAVHARGGVIFLQLWHMGRQSHSSFQPDGLAPFAPSAIPSDGATAVTATGGQAPAETPRALTVEQIAEIVGTYAQAARNAIAAGFDGVEVHGANGYLIDQFLNESTNQRTDQYGGSIENRVRFLVEVSAAVIDAVGADRVGVRLSPIGGVGGVHDDNAKELYGHAISALALLQPAYLHLIEPRIKGAGITDDTDPDAISAVRLYRPLWPGVLIAAGGFTAETGAEIVAERAADAVAHGRAFIANPDLVARIEHGTQWTPWNRPTFYSPGPVGYVDYPRVHQSATEVTR